MKTSSWETARLMAQLRGGEPEDYMEALDSDLESLAAKIGGEVDGNAIRCASPGRPPDDRSCHVRVGSDGQPFIYDCEGSKAAAYAHVRAALGVVETPQRASPGAGERIWAEALSADGTDVEAYLRGRAITLPPPAVLRFHPALWHKPSGGRWPGMVAERTDVAGQRVAIHRTFLLPDGRGKAPVEPPKMDLGPCGGTAIRLGPVAEEIAVAEGIETALSVMQHTGIPSWAAGSAGALRALILPAEVRSIIIFADGDDAGEAVARAAAARWTGEGRIVRTRCAPPGKDFNDVLVEETGR